MKRDEKEPDGKVCLAQIGAAHGIRGEVRIKLFSDDPHALTDYGPLHNADGSQQFIILSARPSKMVFVCRIKGVGDRNGAEALNGTKLYIDRVQLPEPEEEEFYYSDLIGLEAVLEEGTILGHVIAVHDFGAGDLLDIAPKRGKSVLVPFTKEAVPEIDFDAGRVLVIPPEGLLEPADEAEKAREGEAADFSANPELVKGLERD